MADIVMLTGITGFLGGHLARELLASGYHVRGSLRNPARADAVRRALWDAGEDISRLEFVTLNLTIDNAPAMTATDNGSGTITASPAVTYQWIDCTTNQPMVPEMTMAAPISSVPCVFLSIPVCLLLRVVMAEL